MTQPASSEQLIQVFRFNIDDLQANRNGQFSSAQMRRLRGERWRKVWPYLSFAILGGLMAVFMGLNYSAGTRAGGDVNIGFIVFGIAVFFGVLAIVSLWRIVPAWRKATRNLKDEELKVMSGPIKCIIEKDKQGDPLYFVRIGSQKFALSQKQYAAFSDGVRYKLYYASVSRLVLAAEVVDKG